MCGNEENWELSKLLPLYSGQENQLAFPMKLGRVSSFAGQSGQHLCLHCYPLEKNEVITASVSKKK